jgi:hypothetical protein
MAGMSVHAYLHEKDALKRNLMIKIAQRYLDLERELDLNRARMIAREVIRGLGGK